MSCSNCSTDTQGCTSQGNCRQAGCQSSPVIDWLNHISSHTANQDYSVIEFKNNRKEVGLASEHNHFSTGQAVICEDPAGGILLGKVRYSGELARISMRQEQKKRSNYKPLRILRHANQDELDRWHLLIQKEPKHKVQAQKIADKHKLEMKITDVEFQPDGSKLMVYYTANDRVDFRNLIKEYAQVFETKISMKQIGSRQETGMLGGIGSCGRELCCSSWMKDFRSVNTSAARYQQLSLNPQKLAGQCGKLKCCLNFELDSYTDALSEFPTRDVRLQTEKGQAVFQKLNVFSREMWYAYVDGRPAWQKLSLDDVLAIIQLNKKGKKPESLEIYGEPEEEQLFMASLESDLDKRPASKPKNKRNKRNQNRRKPKRKPKSNDTK